MAELGLDTAVNRSPGGPVIPSGQNTPSGCDDLTIADLPYTIPANMRVLRIKFPAITYSTNPIGWENTGQILYNGVSELRTQISALFDAGSVLNYVNGKQCDYALVYQMAAYRLVRDFPDVFSYVN
jgi:hypothetical protein